jgi:hypothetical protein
LEFGNVDFFSGGREGELGGKPSKQGREPTNNSTHMTPSLGIEPGSQCSPLTASHRHSSLTWEVGHSSITAVMSNSCFLSGDSDVDSEPPVALKYKQIFVNKHR